MSGSSTSTPTRRPVAGSIVTSSLPRPSPRPKVVGSTAGTTTSRLPPRTTSSTSTASSSSSHASTPPSSISRGSSAPSRSTPSASRATPSRPRAPLVAKTPTSSTSSPRPRPTAPVPASSQSTPVRVSIKDQIKALRAAQATPVGKGSPSGEVGAKELIKKSADTGRLVIPPTFSPPLQHLPLSLYTLLLGIPPSELSRKPPKPPSNPSSTPLRSSSFDISSQLDSLSLNEHPHDVFGTQPPEDLDTGGFLASVDLETLKVVSQELTSLDLELGLFGGLKVVDFRHNQLSSIPTSFPNLSLLTSLNLSHNNFTCFPPHLTLLPSLVELDLSHNALASLSFLMPPPSPIFPGTPPSSFQSPPDAGRTPLDRPLPSLKVLNLTGNKLQLSALPEREEDNWPVGIETLHLGENPLIPPKGNGILSLAPFLPLKKLKQLFLPNNNIRSLSLSPSPSSSPDSFPHLSLLSLSANPYLTISDLTMTTPPPSFLPSSKTVKLQLGETGTEGEEPTLVHILVDEHLLPKKTEGRRTHVWVPPSPEEEKVRPREQEQDKVEDDPFGFGSLSGSGGGGGRVAGRRDANGLRKPAPLSFDTPSSSSLAPTSSSHPPHPPPSTSDGSSPSVLSFSVDQTDSSDPYACPEFYTSQAQSYHLSLPTRTPHPLFPTGSFSLPLLHTQPFSSSLLSLSLSGRSLSSIITTPIIEGDGKGMSFPSLLRLSFTATPASLPPAGRGQFWEGLRGMCPKLEELEIAECSPGLVGDSLFSSERTVRSLLLGERGGGGGLKKLVMRECGVKDLGGLEAVARELSHGGAEGWRCEEIDLRDNGVEKLDPILGHLPLKQFLVERNLFRAPHRRVWEKDGTAGLLTWLKDRA